MSFEEIGISTATSIFVTLLTIKGKEYIETEKFKKDEIKNLFASNSDILQSLLLICNGKNVDYTSLRTKIQTSKEINYSFPRSLYKKFQKLNRLLEPNGQERKQNLKDIKKISEKIVKQIRKVGVNCSEFK